MLLEAYTEDRLDATEATFQRVQRILDAYSACSSASTADYSVVVKASLRWLDAVRGSPDFADRLHEGAAAFLWARRGLPGLRPALEHCCRSSDVQQTVEIVCSASGVRTRCLPLHRSPDSGLLDLLRLPCKKQFLGTGV